MITYSFTILLTDVEKKEVEGSCHGGANYGFLTEWPLENIWLAGRLSRQIPLHVTHSPIISRFLLQHFLRRTARYRNPNGRYIAKNRMTLGPRATATAAAVAAQRYQDAPAWVNTLAVVCGTWFVVIMIVQAIGSTQLYLKSKF